MGKALDGLELMCVLFLPGQKRGMCVFEYAAGSYETLFVAGMSPNGFGSCLFFASIAKVLPNYSATI